MDLTKMTKDELIEKVQEQTHLAAAVDAKDREIIDIKSKHQSAITAKDTMITTKDKEIIGLKAKVAELESKQRANEELVKGAKFLEEENKKVVNHLNMYIETFRNTLKAQQGVLDNAIQLEAFISESLRRK